MDSEVEKLLVQSAALRERSADLRERLVNLKRHYHYVNAQGADLQGVWDELWSAEKAKVAKAAEQNARRSRDE